MINGDQIISLLTNAIAARLELFDSRHENAFRLFNGFFEGFTNLVIDIYASTIVIHNYANPPEQLATLLTTICQYLTKEFPWLQSIVLKTRNSTDSTTRNGIIFLGEKPNNRIREHKVWYSIDLLLNRDTSFYLDTYNLRAWILDNLASKSVLNTFAYTGSLGVAAKASGASQVIHLDLNRKFLNVAKTSYTLNGFPINKRDFLVGDFWTQISHFKRIGKTFDAVIVDPPFFAITNKGKVDLVNESYRIINKVRPLINNDGYLIVVNNALFVSGADYFSSLEKLCMDGYLSIETLIPVPENFIGYEQTKVNSPLVDPSPFNHSTKIVVLKVRRKATML